MANLTKDLCASLLGLPADLLTTRGERLAARIWAAFPHREGDGRAHPAEPVRGLVATARDGGLGTAETVAFQNALAFCEHNSGTPQAGGMDGETLALSVPVSSATALAEGRGLSCGELNRALGMGLEAYARIIASAGTAADTARFDWPMLAATLAAIVACGTLEGLATDELNMAVGLGGSVVTASTGGYLPLQAAMAAQDSIAMVRLAASGFMAPPDVMACRWGIFDAFSGPGTQDRDALGRAVPDRHTLVAGLRQGGAGSGGEGGVPVRDFVRRAYRGEAAGRAA